MRKLFFATFIALLSIVTTFAGGVAADVDMAATADKKSTQWQSAGSAYSAGDYTLAIDQYQSLINQGVRTWEVYYNLGSAYYKSNQLGRAILNFERAAVLDPSNEDVEYNLAVARAHTVDKIESIAQFFLFEWIGAIGDLLTANWWAVIGMILLAVALGLVLIWRLGGLRWAMSISVVVGLFAVISFCYAHSSYSTMGQSNRAIVINTASVVRSSPDTGGKELFVLHEGSSVDILNSIGSWFEIRIASGSKGWVNGADIEHI